MHGVYVRREEEVSLRTSCVAIFFFFKKKKRKSRGLGWWRVLRVYARKRNFSLRAAVIGKMMVVRSDFFFFKVEKQYAAGL
jgi:hypothetical protein